MYPYLTLRNNFKILHRRKSLVIKRRKENVKYRTILPIRQKLYLYAKFQPDTDMAEDIRIDKWLWAVRIFKTRSDAAEACRTNKVTVNGMVCKPSRELKAGDVVSVRKMPVTYSYRVVALVSSRQPAKNVPDYTENITPQSELDKLNPPKETVFISREKGLGRPTKKERRELDSLMDDVYIDED